MITEGLARVKTDGVFYNPRMKFCRDLDMIVFRVMPGKEYLDALAASGIRGIRAKLEAGKSPVFNDRSRRAFEVILENLKINGIEAEVLREDACVLMRRRQFEHVDVDPFGSPSHFIDSACYSAKLSLSVTATDTAALCGSAKNSCLRKYSCFVEKVEFYPEVGLRVLAGKIAAEATKYDKALEFVACWAKEHYYRVHATIRRSPRLASKVYENMGYLAYCPDCLWRKSLTMEIDSCVCERCGKRAKIYGPMWIGKLKSELLGKAELNEFLKRLYGELDVPFYYELHAVCRRLGVSPPPVSKVISKLIELGFEASRTVLSGTGIRTNAGIEELERAVSECIP